MTKKIEVSSMKSVINRCSGDYREQLQKESELFTKENVQKVAENFLNTAKENDLTLEEIYASLLLAEVMITQQKIKD